MNILITRIPPHGILDKGENGESMGDKILSKRIKSLKSLKMHLFGFASQSGEQYSINNDVLYVNGFMNKSGYIEIVV